MATCKTCKTCKHWVSDGDSDFRADMRASQVCQPVDPDTYEPMALGYEVRKCESPLLRWFETPGPGEASLVDGSDYYAALLTGERFGCVNHEDNA
jgi:hypothetical protein